MNETVQKHSSVLDVKILVINSTLDGLSTIHNHSQPCTVNISIGENWMN